MKRKNIKAGVIYAVKSSYGGSPSPVVFLEDGAAGLYRRGHDGTRFVQAAEDKYTKAKKGTGWTETTYGYAAVVRDGTATLPGGALGALAAIDASAELERFRTIGRPASGLLRFALITSLARIASWDDAVAEYKAARAADRKRWDETNARTQRQTAVLAGLQDLGLSVSAREQGAVGMSLEAAERLLAMLSEKNGG